jgi:hypothetical protein
VSDDTTTETDFEAYWEARDQEVKDHVETTQGALTRAEEQDKTRPNDSVSPILNMIIGKGMNNVVQRATLATILQGCHTLEEHLMQEFRALGEQLFLAGIEYGQSVGDSNSLIWGPCKPREEEPKDENLVQDLSSFLAAFGDDDAGEIDSNPSKPDGGPSTGQYL